jgi:hypothetical protein
MTEVGTRDIAPLDWDMFMTRGISIVTGYVLPGVKEVYFRAMTYRNSIHCGISGATSDLFNILSRINH